MQWKRFLEIQLLISLKILFELKKMISDLLLGSKKEDKLWNRLASVWRQWVMDSVEMLTVSLLVVFVGATKLIICKFGENEVVSDRIEWKRVFQTE